MVYFWAFVKTLAEFVISLVIITAVIIGGVFVIPFIGEHWQVISMAIALSLLAIVWVATFFHYVKKEKMKKLARDLEAPISELSS